MIPVTWHADSVLTIAQVSVSLYANSTTVTCQ